MINNENIEDAKEISTDLVKTETQVPEVIPPAPEVPEDIKKWLAANPYYVLAPGHKLNKLIQQLKEAQAERAVLYDIAYAIMALFGYIDKQTGKMKPEIVSGEESWIPGMLKSLMDITGLLMASKSALTKATRKRNEEELAQKFDFIKHLIPLMQKYGNQPEQNAIVKHEPGTDK